MVRNGNVGVFATGDGSLDTQAELSAVFNLPGNVKVVEDVNWRANRFNSSFIGCGQTPGTSFITERFTASQEGILWIHEFGHNQGLPHRDNTSDNVMFPSIGSNRLRINQAECNAFRGTSGAGAGEAVVEVTDSSNTMPSGAAAMSSRDAAMPSGGLVEPAKGAQMPDGVPVKPRETGTMPAGGEMARSPGAATGPRIPVEEFVSQIYIEGLPLDKAAAYGDEDVDKLLTMLNDPAQSRYHENIALTLGMIGSARAAEPLIAYIEKTVSERGSRLAYKGRVGAIVGLGYLVNRSGSEKALSYLLKSTSPQDWQQRNLRSLAKKPEATDEETTQDLSKYAIISLGLSGHPETAARLRSMRAQARSAVDGSFGSSIGGVVAQSLQEHDKVSRDGLLKYYERSPQ